MRSSEADREVVVPWFPYRPVSVLYGVAPALVSRLGAGLVRRSRAFQAKAKDRPRPTLDDRTRTTTGCRRDRGVVGDR